jgi:hypothetical protein
MLPGAFLYIEEMRFMKLDFKTTRIAGSKNDFLEVNHLILKGSNTAIGSKIGEIAKSNHGINELAPINATISKSHLDYIKENYSILYDRMCGVAKTYQENILQSEKWLSSLLYNINPSACSTVYYPPDKTASGHATVSRNYDFTTGTILGTPPKDGEMPATSRPYIVSMYPDEGYPSLYICSYDLLNGVIDGINSKGLVIVIHGADELVRNNPVRPTFQPDVGLNELQLPRLILDTCSTAEEAKECFMKHKKYYICSPLQYLVADRTGNSYILEPTLDNTPGKSVSNDSNCQILTNFMLSNYESISDLPTFDDNKYFKMYSRYKDIYNRINEVAPPYTPDFIRETNECVFFDQRSRDEINRSLFGTDHNSTISDRTLWHSIYDCHDCSLQVSFYLSDEKRTEYLKFAL